MATGIITLHFGEPASTEKAVVEDYLQRIFLANMDIEGDRTPEDARERASTLARRRAPSLLEEYEAIGGSPLNEQARAQTEAIERALTDRGHDVEAFLGMQYTEPFIGDAVDAAMDAGVDSIVGVPVYPLCGPSTTVAALESLSEELADRDWQPPRTELTGWHRYPPYNRLRAENITDSITSWDITLDDPTTRLVFSAHGTPVHYLEEGSRYQRYVEEYCAAQAALLGVAEYDIGYQNHENRDVPWTEPDIETVVENLEAPERIVVEPVSFMHEQSETLSELDDELAADAAEAGLGFHRVPIPHADEAFSNALADLIEGILAEVSPEYYQFRQCQCRDDPAARCLNAPRSGT